MGMIALVTGASSGFGQIIARDLAMAGHTAYASMRGTSDKNADKVKDNAAFAAGHGVDLRSIDLDVQDEESIARAVEAIVADHGRIDVLVQNAGHMVFGPTEAFLPEQLADLYDVNVLGTQRVNRAVLPHMRAARSGLVVWVSSTSVGGGVPPLLGPYFAAKAGMDALAVCVAKEIAPFGIETAIVVPGAFTTGTNHFAHAGTPKDARVAADYEANGVPEDLAATVPDDADPAGVGRAVVDLVAMPVGKRPLRTYIDPADDGASTVFPVLDRVREQFLHRIGHADLLHPAAR